MGVIFSAVTLWLGLLAATGGFARVPLAKPLPKGLPTTAEPVQLLPDASVQYDPAKEVYIFTYKRFDGRVAHMGFELRTKVDVVVEGSVERLALQHGDRRRQFRYSYTVHSLPTSRQGVNLFGVLTEQPVEDPSRPDDWEVYVPPKPENITGGTGASWSDWKIRPDVPLPPLPVFTEEMMKAHIQSEETGNPILPVIPEVIPGRTGVAPGKHVSGFSFASARLPGIVRCLAMGAHFTPVTHGEPPQEIDHLTHKNDFLYVEGKTVGPVLENPPRDAPAALRQLQAWLSEAERLGWVRSRGLIRKIRFGLEKTAAEWTAHRWQSAAHELSGIIAIAEAEKDKGISSELYAILEFNCEALRASALAQPLRAPHD